MFSIRNRTIKRIKKRASRVIDRYEESHSRSPLMSEIRNLELFSFWERGLFTLIGLVFFYVTYRLLKDDVWWSLPIFLMSGYVTFRGIWGHRLQVCSNADHCSNLNVPASPELILEVIEAKISKLSKILLVFDICFITLIVIIELIMAVVGGIASSLS